jgi:Predicted dioxygenase of extradiol dioxygenase family
MRTTHDVFHLAIPVHDLDAAQQFYVSMLGCKLARRYPDRITVDFFGDQLVCHLTEGMSAERPPSLYPRHFGVTFRDEADFEALHAARFSARSRSTRRSPPGSRAWWRSTTRSCCSTRRGTCWSSSITVIRG